MVGLPEEALAALVPQAADGAVHDVRWSPTGSGFVIIAGKMPAAMSMHNDRGDRVYDFGSAHRNTASWSPTGRFLVLAGFGNLVGDMDFYDIQAGKNPKKVGSNNAHCAVTHGWSPDSR
jgi:translation initiation factor 2A